MESIHGIGEQGELLKVVRGVSTRWKLKHALRGAAYALAGTFIVYAITAIVVHSLNYSETSVMVGRVVCVVAFVALMVQFALRPLLPKIRDERAALYLEEHEPTVDGAIFTSIEVENALKGGNVQISPALAGRLKSNAIERARTIGDGRRVDAAGLRNSWALIAAVIVAATIITKLGPAPLRNGLRLLAMPWKTTEASTLFSIAVDPGNMKVARGGDAEVGARLRNFQSEEVVVLARGADSASWVRVPMTSDSTGHYTARLLDISVATEYLIEANGIRSSTYRIDVVNLPFVKNMNMEYRYPSYTGMAPERFDSTGDIAALKGTLVTLKVETTMPTDGGQVVLDNGEKIKLTPNKDGSLSAAIRVDHTGFYKVELAGPDGSMVTGSLDYTIDMLVDRKPTVVFKKPGRDSRVMAVDEVYTEAEAKDDYGVAKLELVFSVNGDKERTIPLSQATSRVLKEIAAGYTFMLEDYQLQPGDVVSYFARAVDNDAVSGAKAATTDIYFLNVSPYNRDYRQGQGGGGGGGGGGGQQQDNPGQFSQRQRDIIAATFKSSRDSSYMLPKSLSEDVQTIRLSQQKLREDVQGLAQRLVDRGITAQDSNYAKVAKQLSKAGAIMDTAEKTLGATKLTDARGPEQRALQQLSQAEAIFRDITVQQQQQGQGQGQGQPQSEAQDLADLFELRQERMRNQYEEVNRGQAEQQQQEQQQQQAIDSVAQKLKELAQRQQSEDQRARAKADSMNAGRPQQQGGGGGGGGGQRQSAQQAEEAARQLERLARERQSQNLADAARALQNAADEMKRSSATGQNGAMSPEAQRQLEEARRLMDRERQMSDQKNVSDAVNQARQLQAEQQRVNSDVNRLNSADSAQARKEIAQRSGQMADRLRDLQDQMERIARNVQGEQPSTARELRAAADSARSARIESQMRAAQQMADRGMSSNYLRDVTEPQISRGIDNLNRQLDRAQSSSNSSQNQQAGAQSLDKVRDMVNGVESLAERVQQQVDQANARRLTGNDGNQSQQPGSTVPQRRDSLQQNGQQQNGQQQNGQQQNGQQQNGQQQNGQQPGQQQGQSAQSKQGQGQQGQSAQSKQGQGQQGQGQQGQGQQGQGQQGQGQQGQGQQGQGQGQGQQNQQGGGNGGGSQNQGRPGGGNGGNQNNSANQSGGGQNMDPQLQRELAQRLADAEALRRELQRQGRDVSQLDQAIQGLQGASNLRSLSDERAAKLLQTQVDALKSFEFQLARAINGQKEGVRVGRTGDVPPAYRALVDEYYREIGKTPGAKKPPL